MAENKQASPALLAFSQVFAWAVVALLALWVIDERQMLFALFQENAGKLVTLFTEPW